MSKKTKKLLKQRNFDQGKNALKKRKYEGLNVSGVAKILWERKKAWRKSQRGIDLGLGAARSLGDPLYQSGKPVVVVSTYLDECHETYQDGSVLGWRDGNNEIQDSGMVVLPYAGDYVIKKFNKDGIDPSYEPRVMGYRASAQRIAEEELVEVIKFACPDCEVKIIEGYY